MKNIVLPALGAFTGTLVGNVVDEKPLDFGEATEGAALNIIFQYLPTKYLGHKLNKGWTYVRYIYIYILGGMQCIVGRA